MLPVRVVTLLPNGRTQASDFFGGVFLLKQVKTRSAEGVIFAAPSFCDPALLERPMLQDVLGKHKVPHTAFKYAENTGQMAPIREQSGTFADSIKLRSAA